MMETPGRSRMLPAAATLAAAAAAVLTAVAAAPPAQAAAYASYTALGDSYAAAAGVPTTVDASCLRSDHDYPALTAASLKTATFTDMTCSGATTADMTQPQPGTGNPPQFDGLTADTALVTLTIGGNDIGFAGILETCSLLGAADPFGDPCTDYYTSGGTDQLSQRIRSTAPKVASVIQGIHQRSPHARVLVVDYLDILPLQGSCFGDNNTIAPGDYPYLNAKEKQLNQMLGNEASANSAIFVDAYSDSIGHDLCKPPGTAWIDGYITDQSAPVHPNELGEQAYASAVLAALGK
ncbi:MAG TPA: SGNH/GDSL hydrolase family protein [Streptosporangiaceae bacterium]|nr:SGNH/GDSL hydrolase family protein [Streptosporangiaceae bacterium]